MKISEDMAKRFVRYCVALTAIVATFAVAAGVIFSSGFAQVLCAVSAILFVANGIVLAIELTRWSFNFSDADDSRLIVGGIQTQFGLTLLLVLLSCSYWVIHT